MQILHPQNALDVFNLVAFVFAVGIVPACAITTLILGGLDRPYIVYKNWWEAIVAIATTGCLLIAAILWCDTPDHGQPAAIIQVRRPLFDIQEDILAAHADPDAAPSGNGHHQSVVEPTPEEKAILSHLLQAHQAIGELAPQLDTLHARPKGDAWLILFFLGLGILGASQIAWTCSRRAGFLLAPVIFIGRLTIAPVLALCCLLALCGAADAFKKIDRGEKDVFGRTKKTRNVWTALLLLVISGIAVFILTLSINGNKDDVRDGSQSRWF